MAHPELKYVRTRVKSLGQNGSRERGFETLTYERLFPSEFPDALTLAERAEDYHIEYKHRASPPSHRLKPDSRGPPRTRQHAPL